MGRSLRGDIDCLTTLLLLACALAAFAGGFYLGVRL